MTTPYTLQLVPSTHKVVPIEPTEDMIYAAGGWTEDEENAIFAYKDALDAAPPINTPPVLRWDGCKLYSGRAVIAVIYFSEKHKSYRIECKFESCETNWLPLDDTIKNEQEARRAAEKALGFPDGLIIEEV